MDRLDYITKERKGKHLNYEERIKIEDKNRGIIKDRVNK